MYKESRAIEVPELDLRGTSQHPLSPFAPDSTREALCCVLDIWETPRKSRGSRPIKGTGQSCKRKRKAESGTLPKKRKKPRERLGSTSCERKAVGNEQNEPNWHSVDERSSKRRGGGGGGDDDDCERRLQIERKGSPPFHEQFHFQKFRMTRAKTLEAFTRKARQSTILRLGENSAKGQRSPREDKSRGSSATRSQSRIQERSGRKQSFVQSRWLEHIRFVFAECKDRVDDFNVSTLRT
ncbi:hypothetical protein V1478_014594 [Vespula squamosa]|uniref:Uncharacterized protein n=1 Tax=Vespula squamosa TaxID=30214 RepID=A0ABD2A2N9_VESSQ